MILVTVVFRCERSNEWIETTVWPFRQGRFVIVEKRDDNQKVLAQWWFPNDAILSVEAKRLPNVLEEKSK